VNLNVYIYLYLSMTVADDHQALVWDTEPRPQPVEVPILAYAAEGKISKTSGPPLNLI